MNNYEPNINNLTALWKVVSSFFPNNFNDQYLECAYIEDSQWPNRIWAKKPLSISHFEETKENLGGIYKKLTFSHFYVAKENSSFNNNQNFKPKSVQYGMSLSLNDKFKTLRNLEFKIVENENEAQTWSDSFYKAFCYDISLETIIKTKEKIPFYLVYFEKELIGTVILFVTNQAAGIHSLGIIPQKRKQGFATEIMYHILNKSIDQNLSLATLQASEMAKEMYLKMGFSIDFLMENYQLK
tara:strand:+ start:167 stop:889 length:723 start_codon:yes stop_codon:yes gene_type:complete